MSKCPTDSEHLQNVLRHINKVRENCNVVSERLLKRGEAGDFDLAKDLMHLAMQHDASKLGNIVEWKYLRTGLEETPEFKLALESHLSSNAHHPEYWNDISQMPKVYVFEMVCDWKSRSEEFGTDLRQWIKDKALERWNISPQGKIYKWIKECTDLLLDKAF